MVKILDFVQFGGPKPESTEGGGWGSLVKEEEGASLLLG